MRLAITATTIALTVLLAACESTGSSSVARAEREQRVFDELLQMDLARGETVSTVSDFRINGWHLIDDENLVLTAGVHDHYLLELIGPCPGLDFAFGIGIDSPTGMISRSDAVLVEGIHGRLERCIIEEIYALEHVPGDA